MSGEAVFFHQRGSSHKFEKATFDTWSSVIPALFYAHTVMWQWISKSLFSKCDPKDHFFEGTVGPCSPLRINAKREIISQNYVQLQSPLIYRAGVCNPWPGGQKWHRKWSFGARGKDQILKQALRFLKGIANLPWVASELANPLSLTHTAVACGPIWLCTFGQEMPHGCTPLL